ncbi:ABC transporter ATP-binding protein [Psychromonas hadalis]|uniref:dipeptide ABC transporter ATP-binding protein n=1 Tax=Psychromonas hadalis TaxID=211669 RepID=UPI0003B3D1AB|nr:ABC transporter ATP-binding protein [Psychromonas hadalis]
MQKKLTKTILSVENLEITYHVAGQSIKAVRNVSFTIKAGETYGLVGESGSGKSTIAYSIMSYLASNGEQTNGCIFFDGINLADLNQTQLQKIRGLKIAVVPQDPLTSLNPSHKIGAQISEILKIHSQLTNNEINKKVIKILEEVHIPTPELTVDKYPHQLSGGQQQRILIAMAFCTNPKLLVMDEPTTGLDVTTQDRILKLINTMKKEHNTAVLYITHDMGVVKNICDKVGILYAGELVSETSVKDAFNNPPHPYTKNLLACIPSTFDTSESKQKLQVIKGNLPDLKQLKERCIFVERCQYAQHRCFNEIPEMAELSIGRKSKCFLTTLPEQPTKELDLKIDELKKQPQKDLLVVNSLSKFFPVAGGKSRALDDISFTCKKGEILGIVGESGCGKTTLARCIIGLNELSAGSILFNNNNISNAKKRSKDLKKNIQMVFQNPEATLNPQRTIGQIIGRSLTLHEKIPKQDVHKKVIDLLTMVSLDARYIHRYPSEISGGEKQRVGIARAFASNPELIILDEPISSLDVSVQAGILNLLHELQEKYGTTYIFIGHNLAVMRHLCDRIMVIYLGKICEIGTPKEIFSPPYHPYVEGLLSAIPIIEPNLAQRKVNINGEIPNATAVISGCYFKSRCHKKIEGICDNTAPPFIDFGNGHKIACHVTASELTATKPIFSHLA